MTKPTGFTAVPNWLVMTQSVNATAKMVYLVLASHADREGFCWPSHQTIAAEAGVSVDTVQRALIALRGVGALSWTRSRTSNRYRVAVGHAGPDTATVRSDTANLRVLDTADLRHKQDPGNKTQENKTTTPAAAASEPVFTLISEDDPVPEPPPSQRTARDLVDLWVRCCRTTPQGEPDRAIIGQVAGHAARIAKTRTDEASWDSAAAAVKRAGLRRDPNILRELAQVQAPPSAYRRRNYELERTQAAMQGVTALPAPTDPVAELAIKMIRGTR